MDKSELLRRDRYASLEALERGELLHHDGRQHANWPAYMSHITGQDFTDARLGPNRGRVAEGDEAFGFRDWLTYLHPDSIARIAVQSLGVTATVELIMLIAPTKGGSAPLREAALRAIGALAKSEGDSGVRNIRQDIERATRHLPQMPQSPKPNVRPERIEPPLLQLTTEPPEVFAAELAARNSRAGLVEGFMGDEG